VNTSDRPSAGVEPMPLDRPRLYVDFNEILEPGLYLLSKDDVKTDSSGALVHLREGDHVWVYSDDGDKDGQPDALLAKGKIERNQALDSWAAAVRWCVRLDGEEMLHYSDLVRKAGK